MLEYVYNVRFSIFFFFEKYPRHSKIFLFGEALRKHTCFDDTIYIYTRVEDLWLRVV